MLVGGVSGPRNFRPLRPSKSSGRLPSASDTCSRFWLPLANGVKTGWSFDVVARRSGSRMAIQALPCAPHRSLRQNNCCCSENTEEQRG